MIVRRSGSAVPPSVRAAVRPLNSSAEPVRRCTALFIAAPASRQGKTTVTAALARWHRRQGHRVRVFKTGPDFLDPMILERASGAPVYQLDLWLGGEAHCRALLYQAAGEADVILVEGVMGLHDGTPSSADLAARFGIPVLAVIDASAMAQTFGAIAHGLASYRDDVPFAGVLANRVGSAAHGEMLRESLPPSLAWYGALSRDDAFRLPSRHLGLIPAGEIADLEARIERAADAVAPLAAQMDSSVAMPPTEAEPPPPLLAGVRVAIARDAAFSFIYPANLDTLRMLGAAPVFFSPLGDPALPPCDAVWLPGGYPELHLASLAANQGMKDALRAHVAVGRPLWAECGGMLYLLERLADAEGQGADMVGLLPGEGQLQPRLMGLGLHEAVLPEGRLRGHAFHYSTVTTPLAPLTHTQPQRPVRRGEAVYRVGRLTASYFHAYFPSDPVAVAALLAPAGGGETA
ncbi:MAG: cobyrinic acid a,c-diamide synthase [Burkholderiales bacterium 12-64-5]|nr:MAG: cobyrinic acid a,c-diamide synthase [Burkholderiales bacterium 12-64-5]